MVDVLTELRIPRSTFYRWRQIGQGPQGVKLPNGEIRISRRELDHWIDDLSERAA
ncbi:AlpA family transcriptional regulator [Frankia sp. Cj5]|uniref:helix-turn-helix transcriptional regulator n=1 Tax=Frankia sp. Cj5 TaxID=2880978 RepID=UPI001EF62AB1|nr:helix-turn-helix domain-containing protein [Frankia sp. Cj5]